MFFLIFIYSENQDIIIVVFLIYLLLSYKKAIIHLQNLNTFTVEALNISDSTIYVGSKTLNGNELKEKFITYNQIMNGGKLVFKMVNK